MSLGLVWKSIRPWVRQKLNSLRTWPINYYLGALLFFVGLMLLIYLPQKQVEWYGRAIKPEKTPDYVNAFRQTLAQILTGLFLFIGLYLTWRRIAATQASAIADQGKKL